MPHVNDDRNHGVGGIKIHAILADGNRSSGARVARDVAEIFAADIEGVLREKIAPGLVDEQLHRLVRNALEERITEMLVIEAGASQGAAPVSLPVGNLKPSDVIGQRLVQLSLASLYRCVDTNRFYCVKPPGQSNGRVFPEWQFVPPVPELLPAVLSELRGSVTTEVHAFLVTALDELNELAPAELLAGRMFAGRGTPHSSQMRLLQLSAAERQRRVLVAIKRQREGVAH
ncbi:hypothetical protein M3I54_41125 [Paraburkholderia sp. CNPSo 3274]|uniref:hypothetical protein n=1 Tax=Paraburkholderia sp. CNPSo 3274 TaxID=2940932 RepID=UPI0020B85BE7|nr:hypothetical protein [Paraburkholderia sp. CNPSo 3274]MCP3713196.1 hypothetical protein [Paraburkholderia sp. CNPSo 3274]